MSRLKRFEEHRFLGVRDTMRVYDCDDAEQFSELSARAEEDDLWQQNLIQTFGPDELSEARNRSFTPPA